MVFGFADNRKVGSAASGFRQRRVELMKTALDLSAVPRVLDVGGTAEFWRGCAIPAKFTVLNLQAGVSDNPDVECVAGDATDLSQYAEGSFDIVFSNSVIEHVGDSARQKRMADEVRRVGKQYFVQTPNRRFPIEPHFLFPGFQFLPRFARRLVARHWRFGWYARGSAEAIADAERIRLLAVRQFAALFPEARIIGERCGGLIKSLIAIRSPKPFAVPPGFRLLAQGARPPLCGKGRAQ